MIGIREKVRQALLDSGLKQPGEYYDPIPYFGLILQQLVEHIEVLEEELAAVKDNQF